MAISDAVGALITTIKSVTGMKRVVRLTDVVADLPLCVVYMGPGEWTLLPGTGGGMARYLGSVIIDFHAMGREQGATRCYAQMEAYAESIAKAILGDPTLGGYVQHIGGAEGVELYDEGLMQFDYSGAITLGRRWRIPFKYDVAV